MLSREWQELEQLCERMGEMRERSGAARRSNNVGLMESLKHDFDAASRQREQLVRYISARLTSTAV